MLDEVLVFVLSLSIQNVSGGTNFHKRIFFFKFSKIFGFLFL